MSAALALRRAQSRHPDQWDNENYDVWDDGRVIGYIFRVSDGSKFRVREDAETWIWSVDFPFTQYKELWAKVGDVMKG